VGRPRTFCRLCTPRKPEDIAAADERYWRMETEKRKEANRRLREDIRAYRETLRKNGEKRLEKPSLRDVESGNSSNCTVRSAS
jgi:hypothetical protein